jgi:signal transduction histidine kinase
MTRRLILSYLTIAAFTLTVLGIPLGVFAASLQRERLEADLQRDALVLATLYEDALDNNEAFSVRPAQDYRDRTGGRVVVVDANGISIVDTDAAANRDFSTRDEIAEALAGIAQSPDTRFSQTLGREILYVAAPVASGGTVHGAVRITFDPEEVNALVRRYWLGLGAIALVVLAAVTLVGFVIARSVTRPLRAMHAAAIAAGAGDLSVRIEPGSAPVELRDTADAFNSMARRLENLVGRQRAFVADASHELRTPLTALRLRLENVESVVGEEARSDVEAALAESQRLAQLVEQLLTIARSEGAARTTSTVDLASTAAERVNLWQAVAEESDVILEFRVTARPSVRGVEGVVDQVVDNLVSNAISATPEGRRVAVVVDSSSGFGRLRIIDEGPGMSPDDRERAFDRFWRSDHERPGTGLGLAIVREMVIASGGRVELNAASGGGVDAVVMLPEVPAGDASASLNR